MLATVQARADLGGKPCIVKWTGRVGLSVKTKTYCNAEVSAGDGVTQLPDHVAVCEQCLEAVSQI